MDERWAPAPGFSAYEVSTLGRVRRRRPGGCSRPGRLLRPFVVSTGYLAVNLSQDGRRQLRPVHRLVADAFLPPDPMRPEVNHRDGDKHNPRLDNLERATRAENAQHAHDHALQVCAGEANGHARLTAAAVRAIRAAQPSAARSRCARELAAQHGVSWSTIYDVWAGRSWGHLDAAPPLTAG